MLSILSNMMDVDDAVLMEGDRNGTTANRLIGIVDRFVSEVKLEKGEIFGLETENIALKAVSWDPDITYLEDGDADLFFNVRYRKARKKTGLGKRSKHRISSYVNPYSSYTHDLNDFDEDDTDLIVPYEALFIAQNQTYQDIRVKFVAYRNDKFFQTRPSKDWTTCRSRRENMASGCRDQRNGPRFEGRRILQVSIANATIANLTDPVVYTLPSPAHLKVFCAFWNERDRRWSTDGMMTNQSFNSTTCYSTHMTAFSLLLDPTPNRQISKGHHFALSMISYIGCGLSMIGLFLTILTYSLFRCLNRDHPGQILLHLCSSMLLMNTAFVAGSQKGNDLYGVDVCVTVAVLVHYFLLTTLSWMGIEAANMYQLLVHVFATAESHFMLKRSIIAWGVPMIIVGVTVLTDWGVYENQNEYCMLSAENPYVYYISYLGPSCLILLVNLTVFIMVTRVLFTPRNVSKPTAVMQKKEKITITAAQVRGAFTVMVLLGVSWVFGAFAVGEARLVFQYLFCVTNSLQGFLIFIVRCVQHPEARSAWCQLMKTGTLKKYRGMIPPGSWSGNSNSSQNKQNGHSTTTRLGSADANAVAFNVNFWNKTSKDDGNLYDDQQPENGLDFPTRSSQLLTFSRVSKPEDPLDECPQEKPMNRSQSLTSGKLTQGSGSKNVDGHRCHSKSATERGILEPPADHKNRNSCGSSIGYIDEEKERNYNPGNETRASFTARAIAAPDRSVQEKFSEAEKLNSWPRTLSSFVIGKDVQQSPLLDSKCPGTLPKRIISPVVKSPLVESPERHSFQIIPLHLRQSSIPTTQPFAPPLTEATAEPKYREAAETKGSPRPDTLCKWCAKTSCGSFCSSMPLFDSNKTLQTSKGISRDCAVAHDIEHEKFGGSRSSSDDNKCPEVVSSPEALSCSRSDNHVLNAECLDDCDILPQQIDTFDIWERQGLISPSKTMFVDSAASRL